VQDVDEEVQRAVNRLQPFETIEKAARGLRAVGIGGLTIDIMYGLPHQTVAHVVASVEAVASLSPDRLALFGYAHVPHMKTHQNLILEAALPGAAERFAQAEAAANRLAALGYEPIGLDHFARADDPMALAARDGTLRRNFQGYTTDPAEVLIGFGASAIGGGPNGFVQNEPDVRLYKQIVERGELATKRGLALDDDDRLRSALIETLMCSMRVDIAEICARFGRTPESLGLDLDRLDGLVADGLVHVDGWVWEIPEAMRAFMRLPCALFDAYLGTGQARHARAV
jgi:oxygen-independent coproporphyrinogen-3 oxidase